MVRWEMADSRTRVSSESQPCVSVGGPFPGSGGQVVLVNI